MSSSTTRVQDLALYYPECPCPGERLTPPLLTQILYPGLKKPQGWQRGNVLQSHARGFKGQTWIFLSPHTTSGDQSLSFMCRVMHCQCKAPLKSSWDMIYRPAQCISTVCLVYKSTTMRCIMAVTVWADPVWRFSWASQIAVTGAGEQVVPQLAERSHS